MAEIWQTKWSKGAQIDGRSGGRGSVEVVQGRKSAGLAPKHVNVKSSFPSLILPSEQQERKKKIKYHKKEKFFPLLQVIAKNGKQTQAKKKKM